MLTFLIRAAAAPTWVYYPGSETITWPDRYESDEDRKRWELIRT